jgi:hypothetical protein
MGMGQTVDLEPPTLKVTGIVLPDGTEIPLQEEDNKLFVGPGILVGPGFYLKGTAWDNDKVVEITVEETGSGAEIVDGKPRMWTNADIGPQRTVPGAGGGEHDWSISLDGISNGERNILVTAYDFPRNIGPSTVKQLTLLVDIDPPFIDKINVERQPGIAVGLLPKAALEGMDHTMFENIDYFQNEYFTIRASVSHNFSLSGVTLNFIGEDGKALFQKGLERTSSTTVYAPSWYVTANDLITANSVYASGRHYLKVIISARAEAGHSGENEDLTNLLYNLCWYPEADNPKIQMTVASEENEVYRFEKGSQIPVRVFDDDNVDKVYAALIPIVNWNSFMAGNTDEAKLQSLINDRSPFTDLNTNKLSVPARNAVTEVSAGEIRGDYRLVVLSQDKKEDAIKQGVWGQRLFKINIVEEGIPIITVETPTANTSPKLANGKNFTIAGNVQNLDDLDKIKIAWIPTGADAIPGWNANTQGQNALLSGNLSNGIKVWEFNLQPGTDIQFSSGKTYKKQTFSFTFDIFTDFMYNSAVENQNKLFILYAQGKGGDDVFENFRLLSYSKPPSLDITPKSWGEPYAPNGDIKFTIRAESPDGVQIETNAVTLYSDSDNIFIPLTRSGDVWTGTTRQSQKKEEGYDYKITAADKLGKETLQTVTVVVTEDPKLKRITSPHNSGVVFSSRDTITIQAVFDGTVTTVTGTPRLRLEGFIPSSTVRYANYTGGDGTTTLNFQYTPQSGDYTDVPGSTMGLNNGLKVTAFELNGGTVTAIPPNGATITSLSELPSIKILNVDGRAPVITGIVITGVDGDPAYPGWYREGMSVEARVTVDKEISVIGTPSLILQFTGGTRQASFQKIENSNKTMVFSYKIAANDAAEPVRCNGANCFSNDDIKVIIDKAGSNGNYLSLAGGSQYTGVNVDAVPPAALSVTDTTPSNPSSKTIQIQTAAIETYANTKVEYSVNGGAEWTVITSPYTLPVITAANKYTVLARQTDRAGNVSPNSAPLEFTISVCDLIAVTCNNPDNAYPKDSVLTFKLVFSGKVYNPTSSTNTSITIGGGGGSTGTDVTINFPVLLKASADFSMSVTWTVPDGKIWAPVQIKAINISGVRVENNDSTPGGNTASVIAAYNRPNLKVLSVLPTITQINGTSVAPTIPTNIVLAAANTTVTLTFSQAVWPEKGMITVKPAANWHIPPVLSNDDYSKVYNAATTSTYKTYLDDNYVKTTHGLKQSGANYVPDTDTKYVLKFEHNLSDVSGAVNNVRTALTSAKYLWQEIESVSTTQVTGGGGTAITLTLDALPNGRQWKIEIDAGAFRDEAGNTFAGWGTTPVYTFWSYKTAEPVIRVNRVSNNRATSASAGTLQTGVQYRIDCETPGVNIQFGDTRSNTNANSPTKVSPVAVTTTPGAPYVANSNDGSQNSANTDATSTDLTGITLAAYTANSTQTIDDNSYTTARKDYIAATAQRSSAPNLTVSERAYEGAFKTVVVYRGVQAQLTGGSGRYLKIEGTNLRNGAVTIAGFPLNMNDMSGNNSKFAYRNGSAASDDWIWITWEIVSEFWQVSPLSLTSNQPGALFNYGDGDNSWQPFHANYLVHNYRKYGNWGMQIGDN